MAEITPEAIALADACRQAGLEFMRGTAGEWGRRELATWLVVKYGAVAEKQERGAHASGSLKSDTISDVLREARWKVFAELEEAEHGAQRWLQALVSRGLVARDPVKLWVPIDRPGTRLRSRVLSLFAVDCLVRPTEYATLLFACPRCESIVFDAEARRVGRCCSKQTVGSGVRPRLVDFRQSVVPPAIKRGS